MIHATGKPVLMIHTVTEDIFRLPLDQYVLTFDDGLYSQFFYYPRFKDIPTQKIYFVSSGIVCSGIQSTEFPTSKEAHEKAARGNYEDYMNVDQIRHLMEDPYVEIGGHSHSHTRLSTFKTLVERVRYIKTDTAQMLGWFESTLGIFPTSFCFPYNEDYRGMYSMLVKQAGITTVYGNERIPVETLLTL